MLDSDGDGKVSLEDYILFCGAYNVSEAQARMSFGLFDRDDSGDITQQEVEEMVKEFYLSDDPKAPGNLFFGNL
jgi:Ca2+-binding EF-hand superfamily protein